MHRLGEAGSVLPDLLTLVLPRRGLLSVRRPGMQVCLHFTEGEALVAGAVKSVPNQPEVGVLTPSLVADNDGPILGYLSGWGYKRPLRSWAQRVVNCGLGFTTSPAGSSLLHPKCQTRSHGMWIKCFRTGL